MLSSVWSCFKTFFICTFNARKVTFIHFLFAWRIALQFLSENRLNGRQILGLFGSVFKTEYEQNFGFQAPLYLRT